MKILIVTENSGLRRTLRDVLGEGHDVTDFPGEDLRRTIPREAFDCVIVDPGFDSELRALVSSIRRAVTDYTYVVVIAPPGPLDPTSDLWRGSINAVVTLPLDPMTVEALIANLERLRATMDHLGNLSEDFPSAGGIISRSAFNQIFLSGIDRAGRYAERTSMIFFSIENFSEILKLDGTFAADGLAARLAQVLSRLRRQSDIIAQTGRGEFCLLLQRPQFETEPVEAARRFADSLATVNINEDLLTDVPVEIRLFELPSGSVAALHRVVFAPASLLTKGTK